MGVHRSLFGKRDIYCVITWYAYRTQVVKQQRRIIELLNGTFTPISPVIYFLKLNFHIRGATYNAYKNTRKNK